MLGISNSLSPVMSVTFDGKQNPPAYNEQANKATRTHHKNICFCTENLIIFASYNHKHA